MRHGVTETKADLKRQTSSNNTDIEEAIPSDEASASWPVGKQDIDLTKWMSNIDDDTPLSALTIPGTHDSAAYPLPLPFVQTQKLNVRKQLLAGIRYFDFRCGLRDDVVEMVHGPTFLGHTLSSILDTVYIWLDHHRSEALIVQIKEDRNGQRSTKDFSHAITEVLGRHSEYWRTENTPCSLSHLRGRIQLFRRFEGPTLLAYGIDVTEWEDNPSEPFTIYTCHGVQITIQDHYSPPSGTTLPAMILEKGWNVSQMIQLARDDKDLSHWFVNFTSAYELSMLYQIKPRQVALGGYWRFHWEDGINLRLRAFLRTRGKEKERLGILAMDFPDEGAEDLVAALVLKNFDRTRPRGTSHGQATLVLLAFSTLVLLYFYLEFFTVVEVLGRYSPFWFAAQHLLQERE